MKNHHNEDEEDHLFESDNLQLDNVPGGGGASSHQIPQRGAAAYHTVSSMEDGREEDVCLTDSDDEIVGSNEERWTKLLLQPLLPDDRFTIARVKLLDGPCAVKLLKFVLLTFLGIVAMFGLVRWVGWEHDESLTLANIWVYESNLIVMDATLFFFVGRLHQQQRRGVDHLAWMAWAFLANLYSSGITAVSFLQHAFTLYEMHCLWPWSLWIFVVLAAVLVTGVILCHVQRAVQQGVFVQKLLELALCVVFFLLPQLQSPYFHFHHWFAGWLVGMHCNFDVWWSRAVMAWCWGCYMNGIAVYGRDPVLTCGYAYYLSTSLGCPYMKCYLEGIRNPSSGNHTHVEPMLPPDWRNCSANVYHS